MASDDPIEELENGIQQFDQYYSAKRVALAAFLVGVFTIGLTYLGYALTTMGLVAIIVFGVVGFFSVHLMMLFIMPTSKNLAESCDLLCSAVREPSRIKSVGRKGIQLMDKEGALHTLTGPDLEAWRMKVVPYFMQNQILVQPSVQAKPERNYTASERK